MDWKQYEQEVYDELISLFPDAHVLRDQRRMGRSGMMRQLDFLVEEHVAGRLVSIVWDGKYFSRKVDVEEVEAFTGLVRDVGAHKGVLVTNVGYTAGALKRAQSEEWDIELDILTPAEFAQFQAKCALPYVGSWSVLLPAPFGWVVDASRWVVDGPPSRGGHPLAVMYRRGLRSFNQAQRETEFIYINFWIKHNETDTLDNLLAQQETDLTDYYPGEVEVTYPPSAMVRQGAETRLRLARIGTEAGKFLLEYTGFVDFPGFIFFAVLFTQEMTAMRNLRKLEHVIEKVLPISVVHSPSPVTRQGFLKKER